MLEWLRLLIATIKHCIACFCVLSVVQSVSVRTVSAVWLCLLSLCAAQEQTAEWTVTTCPLWPSLSVEDSQKTERSLKVHRLAHNQHCILIMYNRTTWNAFIKHSCQHLRTWVEYLSGHVHSNEYIFMHPYWFTVLSLSFRAFPAEVCVFSAVCW